MAKKTPRRKLIEKLDKLVMEKVRERDNWTCQWCGKHVEKRNAHVSHVIPRSKGYALRWDFNNLKLLCFHCHINRYHKDPLEAAEWFKGKFPDRWEYLEERRNDIKKWTLEELKELVDEIKTTI